MMSSKIHQGQSRKLWCTGTKAGTSFIFTGRIECL